MSEPTTGPWDAEGIYVRARRDNELICGAYIGRARHTKTQEANARLISAAPDLLAACEAAARWFGGDSDLEHYESVNDWFFADTGMMRPGKDMPAGLDDASDRHVAFINWAADKRRKVAADLRAAIAKARGGP